MPYQYLSRVRRWLEEIEQQATDFRLQAATRNWADSDTPDAGEEMRAEADRFDDLASALRAFIRNSPGVEEAPPDRPSGSGAAPT